MCYSFAGSVLHGAYLAVPLKSIDGMRLRRIAKLTELPGKQDDGRLIFLKVRASTPGRQGSACWASWSEAG